MIFPKTINYNKSTISLDDEKWKIYKSNNEKSQRNKEINNINEKTIDNNKNIEKIKLPIYSKINQDSSSFKILLEKNKQLMKENGYLKQVIRNKDKLISDFGILFQQFKEKFIKFDEINQSLKMRLNKYKKDNMEENINIIENDYLNKLKEKDKMLEKMNQELIYMHNEYKNLTNNLEQVNNYMNNLDYTELKKKINDLSKENDYLIKLNKRREKRIIDLIKMNEHENKNDEIDDNNENLVVTFKNQENEYIKTINMLQNRIIDKDKEIEMIKEEFKKILNEE